MIFRRVGTPHPSGKYAYTQITIKPGGTAHLRPSSKTVKLFYRQASAKAARCGPLEPKYKSNTGPKVYATQLVNLHNNDYLRADIQGANTDADTNHAFRGQSNRGMYSPGPSNSFPLYGDYPLKSAEGRFRVVPIRNRAGL